MAWDYKKWEDFDNIILFQKDNQLYYTFQKLEYFKDRVKVIESRTCLFEDVLDLEARASRGGKLIVSVKFNN